MEAEANLGLPGLVVELGQQDQRGTAAGGEGRSVGAPQHHSLALEHPLRSGADPAAPNHLHPGAGQHRVQPLPGSLGHGCEEALRPGRGHGESPTRGARGLSRGGDRQLSEQTQET